MENKQTAVEWLFEQLEEKGDARETPSIRNIQFNLDTSDYLELKRIALEKEKEQKCSFYNTLTNVVQNHQKQSKC